MKLGLGLFLAALTTGSEPGSEPVAPKKAPTRSMVKAQIEALRGAEDESWQAAWSALVGYGEAAAELVADQVGDSDPDFRMTIADLLGTLRSPSTVEKISRQLRREADLGVRRKLVQALGAIGGSGIVAPLSEQLQREPQAAVLRDCLYSLAGSNDPSAADIILEFAEKTEDTYLQEVSCLALRRLTKRSFELKVSTWREWWNRNRAATMKRQEALVRKQAAEEKEAPNH